MSTERVLFAFVIVLALTLNVSGHPGLTTQVLANGVLVALASKGYWSDAQTRQPLPLAELAGAPLIGLSSADPLAAKTSIGVAQWRPTDCVGQLRLPGCNADAKVPDMTPKEAAAKGADVILPPELFCGHYFCKTQEEEHFARAMEWPDHPAVRQYAELAAELGVVLPISFYEAAGNTFFNTLAMIDADGTTLGIYRKTHIPQGPGYEEKYYFRPGNTGFKVWDVFGTRIGVGVCWDQWYPECARAMAMMGAELLFYPSAIGSEPYDADLDTSRMWRRAMIGHSVSNCMPVVAANRIGSERGGRFLGCSLIAGTNGWPLGKVGGAEDECILYADVDLSAARSAPIWNSLNDLPRDRRTDLYDATLGYRLHAPMPR